MLRLDFTLVRRIKLLSIIFSKYDKIRTKIKQNLKKSRRISIALDA